MKTILGFLICLCLFLSGCGNAPPQQAGTKGASYSHGPAQIFDEQVYINEVIAKASETYANADLPAEITLYRLATIPNNYQLGYIEDWNIEVRYRYYSNELAEQLYDEDWTSISFEVRGEMQENGTIYFSWMTADKNMTEEEATAFLQRFAEGSDMYPYGDTGYYINRAPHSPQRTDVQFIFMWMQDNHVFEMGLPGSPEISEENIADYCRAEAFTVSTN